MLGKLGLGVSLAASTETTIKVDKIFRPRRNIKILFLSSPWKTSTSSFLPVPATGLSGFEA